MNLDTEGSWCQKLDTFQFCVWAIFTPCVRTCQIINNHITTDIGRRIKSGSCGVPHVEASFSKAAEPTQLRVRRSGDKAHVDNANERYNHADYEYAEYSTGDTEVVRTKTFIGDLISRNDTTTLSRIVGGEEVVPNSFPWQVSLRYKYGNIL